MEGVPVDLSWWPTGCIILLTFFVGTTLSCLESACFLRQCFPYGGTGGSVSDRRRSVFSRNPTGVSLRNYLFFSANASPALAPSERGGRSREEAGDTYLAARGEGADAAGGCGLVALARTIAQWRGRRRLPSKARTSARRAVDAPFAGWSTGSTGRPPDLAKAVEWRDAWGARHGHKAEDRTSRNNQ